LPQATEEVEESDHEEGKEEDPALVHVLFVRD
jgi:hypothetical protein